MSTYELPRIGVGDEAVYVYVDLITRDDEGKIGCFYTVCNVKGWLHLSGTDLWSGANEPWNLDTEKKMVEHLCGFLAAAGESLYLYSTRVYTGVSEYAHQYTWDQQEFLKRHHERFSEGARMFTPDEEEVHAG